MNLTPSAIIVNALQNVCQPAALVLSQGSMPLSITSAAYATRFRRMWGTIPASGALFRCNRKSAPLPNGILPHIATKRCPTSNGISAPLRPESARPPPTCSCGHQSRLNSNRHRRIPLREAAPLEPASSSRLSTVAYCTHRRRLIGATANSGSNTLTVGMVQARDLQFQLNRWGTSRV